MEKQQLPEKIWLKEEYEKIPKGSCIHVKSATKNNYKGIWSSMGGTYNVSVPKKLCRTTSELEETKKAVEKYLHSQK